MNAVNMFVNCKLNEIVYIKQPSEFEMSKVLQLRKVLYKLRRSPLLWQKKLTSTFRSLEFKEISQKSCVIINRNVIAFFYVDDIVICYKKKNEVKAKTAVADLKT